MQVLQTLKKSVPSAKGVVQNSITGVGFDQVVRTVDNIFGAPVQRIFSFNLPIIGTIGVIDVVNYFVHAGGPSVSKNGFIAVIAAKITNGVLPSIGGFKLPGSASTSSIGKTSPVGSGVSGAPS